jgi:hypothetical protein
MASGRAGVLSGAVAFPSSAAAGGSVTRSATARGTGAAPLSVFYRLPTEGYTRGDKFR